MSSTQDESVVSTQKVITHSGTFHCDEVMACALLKIIYPNLQVIRTRNLKVINESTDAIVVDVGMVYDRTRLRFDHHQTSFTEKFDKVYKTQMSSCGLIWKYYGNQIIESLSVGSIDIDYIYYRFYRDFIYQIDCGDNGVANDYKKCTYIPTELGQMISSFNTDVLATDKSYQDFMSAVQWSHTLIVNKLSKLIGQSYDWQKYLPVFEQALESRAHPNILVIDREFNIRNYLKKFDPQQEIKIVLVGAIREQVPMWLFWTVNDKGPFDMLVPLISESHAQEYGLRPAPEGIDFIHKKLFTGACENFNTAWKVAVKSIDEYNAQFDHRHNYIMFILLIIGLIFLAY